MPDVYTDVGTIQNTPTPGSPLDAQYAAGKVRVVQAVYEASALAADQVSVFVKRAKEISC